MFQQPDAAAATVLLQAARAGSKDALGSLYVKSRPYLLCVARKRLASDLQSRLDPADVVQNTFEKVLRSFGSFTGETLQEWRRWLVTILRNTCAKANRRGHQKCRSVDSEVHVHGRGTALGLPDDLAVTTTTPAKQFEQQEMLASLRKEMSRLTPLLRRVVRLRFWRGHSCADIARRLGRSENAIQKLVHRALQIMHALLDSCDNDGSNPVLPQPLPSSHAASPFPSVSEVVSLAVRQSITNHGPLTCVG